MKSILVLWDFILSEIDSSKYADVCLDYFQPTPSEDPLIGLEFLCLSMILSRKLDLFENEYSACLGILMSYKHP